jgi:hypothetical protein
MPASRSFLSGGPAPPLVAPRERAKAPPPTSTTGTARTVQTIASLPAPPSAWSASAASARARPMHPTVATTNLGRPTRTVATTSAGPAATSASGWRPATPRQQRATVLRAPRRAARRRLSRRRLSAAPPVRPASLMEAVCNLRRHRSPSSSAVTRASLPPLKRRAGTVRLSLRLAYSLDCESIAHAERPAAPPRGFEVPIRDEPRGTRASPAYDASPPAGSVACGQASALEANEQRAAHGHLTSFTTATQCTV